MYTPREASTSSAARTRLSASYDWRFEAQHFWEVEKKDVPTVSPTEVLLNLNRCEQIPKQYASVLQLSQDTDYICFLLCVL
jgi:hypothetical protein